MVVPVSQPCFHDAPTPGRVDKEYVTGPPRVAEVICGKTAAEIAGAVMARLPGPLESCENTNQPTCPTRISRF